MMVTYCRRAAVVVVTLVSIAAAPRAWAQETAGASTPNNVVGDVVARLLALRGRTVADLTGLTG